MPWWPQIIVRPRVRITVPRYGLPIDPLKAAVFGVVYLTVFFVLGGNIYTLINTPPPMVGTPNGFPRLFAYGLDAQLGIEGIVASITALIGVLGLGLIYYSSKFVFSPTHATRMMILGMILTGVAFLVYSYMYAIKMQLI